MNQTEIEAIACEYAESVHPKSEGKGWEIPTDNQFEVWRRVVEYDVETLFEPFLRWLSERYDIVSKEKIKKERETAEWTGNEGGLYVLKMLFPQTLKSEENE